MGAVRADSFKYLLYDDEDSHSAAVRKIERRRNPDERRSVVEVVCCGNGTENRHGILLEKSQAYGAYFVDSKDEHVFLLSGIELF